MSGNGWYTLLYKLSKNVFENLFLTGGMNVLGVNIVSDYECLEECVLLVFQIKATSSVCSNNVFY